MVVPRKSKPGTKQFDFTRMFKCGACGSGITAQEKIKRLKSGEIKKYIYYHCTQFKNFDCSEPYLEERKLVKQISELIYEKVTVADINTKPLLKPELDKFLIIKTTMQSDDENDEDIDLKDFIKYIFQNSTVDQKRELIGCLKTTVYLKDKRIVLEI